MHVKTHFEAADIRWLWSSLLAMRGLGWVTLAGAVWLGVSAIVIYAPLPALLSTVALVLAHALAGVWGYLGWSILLLFVLLLVIVVWLRRLYPGWGDYVMSEFRTVDFRRDCLRAGRVKQDEKGRTSESDSDALDGYFAYLNDGAVLVVLIIPRGVKGPDIADAAKRGVKGYADSRLPGMTSGSPREIKGVAWYWVYRPAE